MMQATILPALVLAQIEPQYIMSRMTFDVSRIRPCSFFVLVKMPSSADWSGQREASSKMYSSTIFAFTQLLAEMRGYQRYHGVVSS